MERGVSHFRPALDQGMGVVRHPRSALGVFKDGRWLEREDGQIEIVDIVLDKSDFEMRLITQEGAAAEPIARGQGLVVLEARDFVRLVQNARKDAGLRLPIASCSPPSSTARSPTP
jgi:hypothetical protein